MLSIQQLTSLYVRLLISYLSSSQIALLSRCFEILVGGCVRCQYWTVEF